MKGITFRNQKYLAGCLVVLIRYGQARIISQSTGVLILRTETIKLSMNAEIIVNLSMTWLFPRSMSGILYQIYLIGQFWLVRAETSLGFDRGSDAKLTDRASVEQENYTVSTQNNHFLLLRFLQNSTDILTLKTDTDRVTRLAR